MPKPLTRNQRRVLRFIRNFSKKNGYSPSITEIAKHFGKSYGTIQPILRRMVEAGALAPHKPYSKRGYYEN